MVNAQDQVAGSRWRLAVVVVGAAVLISPALRDHDSFPLSTYPVYASARAREATFVTAQGRRVDGSVQRLSMEVIARTRRSLDREFACRGGCRCWPCR